MIVVGGAAAGAGEALLGPARAVLAKRSRAAGRRAPLPRWWRPASVPVPAWWERLSWAGRRAMSTGRSLVGGALMALGAISLLDAAGVLEAGGVVGQWWPTLFIALGLVQWPPSGGSRRGSSSSSWAARCC